MSLSLRNKYIRFSIQLLHMVVALPLHWLGILIPKSKSIWVFGNTYGYKDNSKYLYEYQLNDVSIRAVWISKEREVKNVRGEWYYYLSLKGLYFQYRAGVACLATGFGDIARFTLARTFIVQLWHGIPIKKLLLDSPEISPISGRIRFLNRLFYWQLRRYLQRYDMLVAVNEHNQDCLSRAFGLKKDRVVITGVPRHDIVLMSGGGAHAERYRVLYAPTWRPTASEAEICLRKVLSQKSLSYFKEKKIDVDVSIHPLNSDIVSIVESLDGVNTYQGEDINYDLSSYDLLITDYSSIALDFSLMNRPVIFMCDDLEKYVKDRGVYEYFLNIVRANHVETQLALIKRINEEASLNRPDVINLYDIKADGNARKRIVAEIKRKL